MACDSERAQPGAPVPTRRSVSFSEPLSISYIPVDCDPADFSGSVSVPLLLSNRSRRLLDLFSGSGSVGAVYRSCGWQVISLDSDPKWGASIQMDIRQWDYKQFPRDFFGAIFIAPPVPSTSPP